MSVTYEIARDEGLIYLRYGGEPTYAEWEAAMQALLADPLFASDLCVIADRRGIQAAPTSEYVRRVATFGQTHSQLHGMRWAVVVASQEAAAMAGLGTKLVGWAAATEQAVFTDLAAALAWARPRRSI